MLDSGNEAYPVIQRYAYLSYYQATWRRIACHPNMQDTPILYLCHTLTFFSINISQTLQCEHISCYGWNTFHSFNHYTSWHNIKCGYIGWNPVPRQVHASPFIRVISRSQCAAFPIITNTQSHTVRARERENAPEVLVNFLSAILLCVAHRH